MSAAVERQFIIIGEAFSRLSKTDPKAASLIDQFSEIIGFRNVVVHGYDTIEDAIVWGIICNELRPLLQMVEDVLSGT